MVLLYDSMLCGSLFPMLLLSMLLLSDSLISVVLISMVLLSVPLISMVYSCSAIPCKDACPLTCPALSSACCICLHAVPTLNHGLHA